MWYNDVGLSVMECASLCDRTLWQEVVDKAHQEHRGNHDEQIGEYQYVFFDVGQHKWKMIWFGIRADRR